MRLGRGGTGISQIASRLIGLFVITFFWSLAARINTKQERKGSVIKISNIEPAFLSFVLLFGQLLRPKGRHVITKISKENHKKNGKNSKRKNENK
jgi:hypothetical protein